MPLLGRQHSRQGPKRPCSVPVLNLGILASKAAPDKRFGRFGVLRGDVRRFLRLEVEDEMNPRFTFSSGQRRALGLAFLLAVHLSRPWCKLRTIVLDDPIQHIDDYRALHLVEALACVRQLGEQVLCTTEDPALADLLGRRLRSSANATGTRVDLQYKPGSGIEVSRVEEMIPLPNRVLVSA